MLVGDTGIEPVTSSVSRKRSPTELIARGGGGNRTRVQGFAGPCLSHSATPPLPAPRRERKGSREPCGPSAAYHGVRRLRADDGIRTRDPHLGKVMLYQLSHVRVTAHRRGETLPAETGAFQNFSRSWSASKLAWRRTRQAWHVSPGLCLPGTRPAGAA